MLLAAGALLAWSLLGMVCSPLLVARRRWPARHPRLALWLWAVLLLSGAAGVVVSLVLVVALARATQGGGPASSPHEVAEGLALSAVGCLLTAVVGGVGALVAYRVVPLLRRRGDVAAALKGAGVAAVRRGAPVSVLETAQPLAFSTTAGGRPRVVVSTALMDLLDDDELDAVIAHERAHLRGRHGLVTGLAALQRACTPRLPCARALDSSVRLLVELAADDVAARRCGRDVTAAAMRKLPAPPGGPAGLLAWRADRLDIHCEASAPKSA